VSRDL